MNAYHKEIAAYYDATEAAYTDGWDLKNSLSLHYGYKDEQTRNFGDTLLRMNEVMMQIAGINAGDRVLDAGCGIGGSSIYLTQKTGCHCTGISLNAKQVSKARELARERGLEQNTRFEVMSYMQTDFPDAAFDVVWGLESICYADDKKQFIQEAWRLLKPGGRLIIADGMVTDFKNNDHPIIKKWLSGWKVNYLESPARFEQFFRETGFTGFAYHDITKHTRHSSRRLLWLYYGSKIWAFWKKITFRYRWSPVQEGNINACLYQYKGMKQGLWGYGIVTGRKEN